MKQAFLVIIGHVQDSNPLALSMIGEGEHEKKENNGSKSVELQGIEVIFERY